MTLNGVAIILFVSIIFSVVIWTVETFFFPKNKENKINDKKDAYTSSKAVNAKDDLTAEFRGLVSDLVMLKAKSAAKLLTYKEADSKDCPKEKLISPEDMEMAFWEAANLVSQNCALDRCPCKTNCDKQTLAQKIKNIRKNLKEKSQTP